MKQIALPLLAALALAAPSYGQTNAQAQQDQQTLALIRDLQTQQVAIAENQAKIEAKIGNLAEALRLARIYSSRAGQTEKKP